MRDLIDREALVRAMKESKSKLGNGVIGKRMQQVVDVITRCVQEAPSVDAVTIAYGKRAKMDFVYRENVIFEVYKSCLKNGIEMAVFKTIREAINKAVKYDIAGVTHGEWVIADAPCEEYKCSICGGAAWYYDYDRRIHESRFCPNCGAIMDGGDHDA